MLASSLFALSLVHCICFLIECVFVCGFCFSCFTGSFLELTSCSTITIRFLVELTFRCERCCVMSIVTSSCVLVGCNAYKE